MCTNYQPSIGIIADDLTSAADGAAPFVARGLAASIGRGRAPRQKLKVVSVDSRSRSATSSLAHERVAQLTAQLANCDVLYKTVDSTLRGHITVELAACFAASGRDSIVFAPAFPEAGRTTKGGVQFVDGIPVSESVYGRDPVHPARHSSLAELVPAGIRNFTLLDAETQEELDSQVASFANPESILWVGSPGMATALSRRFVPTKKVPTSCKGIDNDLLVVIGSANLRSHLQADQLEASNGLTLLRGPTARDRDSAGLLRHIANNAVQLLKAPRFGALIATGGDTMEAILDQLNVWEFEILEELDPGFPLGHARLEDGRTLLIGMKAGGFGTDDVLKRAAARIRGASNL